MNKIDPTAHVDTRARIGSEVSIGPYCVLDGNVEIGDGCRLISHVHVSGDTKIGTQTVVYPFASLGSPPQSTSYRGGATRLVIGNGCDIREHVTMSLGTEDGGGITTVGDRCFIMAGAHVAHDCHVGSNVTMANNVLLAGHVTVGDFVVFGGGAAVRQFSRIGDGAMIVGLSGVRADVIPWALAMGAPLADLAGLNVVGMRRRGFSKADIQQYRQAYRALFRGEGEFRPRLEQVAKDFADNARVRAMIDFIKAGKRPLTMAAAHGVDGSDE